MSTGYLENLDVFLYYLSFIGTPIVFGDIKQMAEGS